MSETLHLKNVGPIQDAEVRFGDLTVLVGPQATGKSIFLQFLKLLLDTGPIFRTLRRNGLEWDRRVDTFLDVYLGEGMSSVWQKDSEIRWNGSYVGLLSLVGSPKKKEHEEAFFIPAQRVLTLSREGWLRPFTDYRAGDPFTVRDFSEKLRVLMDTGFGGGKYVFPQPRRLKSEIRRLVSKNIFGGFRLDLDKTGAQKRLVLREPGEDATKLPFMVWSAGQREFVPLLLGLYWLTPPTAVKRREQVRWVMIEELEMGLHPKGIEVMLLMVLELLWRGYRVCLSTHSPHVLDLVWALQVLRRHKAHAKHVMKIFGFRTGNPALWKLGRAALEKEARVYFFDRETGTARDISNLSPAAEQPAEAEWGGLTELSGRVERIVSDAVARATSQG
jgi:hypothetical protein